MRTRFLLAVIGLFLLTAIARADGRRDAIAVASKFVDQMCGAVSKAESTEAADLLDGMAKLEIEKALGKTPAVIQVKAITGYCHIVIYTTEWRIWSQAEKGQITDSGFQVE